MTGIQATELTDYSNSDPQGACMAPEAALRLRELIEGKNVTLSAVDAASAGSRNRPQRYVRAVVDGEAADVGRILLGEGLALWSSNGDEWVKNTEYYLAARRARAEKIGIWDPTYTGGQCEVGPQQDAVLDMRVQWDADSGDGTNVNGEWAQILNRGDEAVDISGWTFRDASLATGGVRNTFAFPAGASIPPGGSIQLMVGSGTDVPG